MKDPPSSEPAAPSVTSPAPVSTTSASAPPAAAEEQPDLRLTVTFDQSSYDPMNVVVVRASVVNAGTGTANNVRLTDSGNLTSHTWDGFTGRYVVLAPGQTADGVAMASVADVTENVVRLTVEVTSDEPDAAPADNSRTITAPLTVVRGGFSGIAYGDHNRNQVMDPGEALAGLHIHASAAHWSADAVTDGQGRFAFHDLLAGTWYVYPSSPDWTFTYPAVEVTGDSEPEVVLRGEYDITGWLTGSARLSAPTYAGGDTARMIVTVANSGRGPVPGLTAYCWTNDYAQPVGLGELDPAGPGATIPAASSRTFEITVPVRQEAVIAGYLEVHCRIQPPGYYAAVDVTATARVPGARAIKSIGYVVTPIYGCGCYPQYDRVPGVKVYLRNQVTGAIVARAVSDAEGTVVFSDLPADRYDVGIVGPWQGQWGRTQVWLARGGDDGSYFRNWIVIVPGPDQPDPDAVPPAAKPPAGAAARPAPARQVVAGPGTGRLASTGVDVGWLALGGLLTFAAGVSLVLGGRRRI
ncbi:carboxypeptidase-like regulatory domain-containing protein [Streptomyces sp. MN03-5084-2B]|nr:carboxypeptidase-like regulatory domain-containing protein [Streptomyces sp. MN03-5084-2B]